MRISNDCRLAVNITDYIHAIVKYPAMYKSLSELGREEVNNIKWYDAGLKVRHIYDLVLRGYHY